MLYQTLWTNDDDGESPRKMAPDLTPIGDSLLALTNNPYVRFTYNCDSSDLEEDILFVKNKRGMTRTTYVLVQNENYYIVCSRKVQDPCDCDSYVAIYIPDSNTYKNTERPFSFSLRRDLVDALNKYANLSLDKDEYHDQCGLLTALGAR